MCSAEMATVLDVFSKQLQDKDSADVLISSQDQWQPTIYYAAKQSLLAKALDTSVLPREPFFEPSCNLLNLGDANRRRPPPFGVNLFATCSRINLTDYSTARWEAGRPLYTGTFPNFFLLIYVTCQVRIS